MGKTPKPLRILVHPTFFGQGWIGELQSKGHTVVPMPLDLDAYDLILAPQAARFLPGMQKHLDSFIKGARKIKYETD